MKDKAKKGRASSPYGELAPWSKLTESDVRKILIDPRPHAEIAHQFNVTTMTISDIKCRRSWTHLDDVVVVKGKKRGPNRGVGKKLTEMDVLTIRESKEPQSVLAVQYSVSRGLINNIVKRRSWAHI